MRLFIAIIVASVVAIIGIYVLPVFVPFVMSFTSAAHTSGVVPAGTNVAFMTDIWPLILGGIVIAIIIAVIIAGTRRGGSV